MLRERAKSVKENRQKETEGIHERRKLQSWVSIAGTIAFSIGMETRSTDKLSGWTLVIIGGLSILYANLVVPHRDS